MTLKDIQEKFLKSAESIRGLELFKGIKLFFENLLKNIPENKRKPVAVGGGCVFLIICIMIIAASGNRSGTRSERESPSVVLGPHIPAEDLFYPAEPDFLPGLLLEREPRQPWTTEGLRPFWRDPAEPKDVWLEKMSESIDKLMESVP
jgi:hypothetical protein